MGRTFLRHFDYTEFDCYLQENSGYRHMDREFLLMIDEARDITGLTFRILRGYVSPQFAKRSNILITSNSPHKVGRAACIWCKNGEKRIRIVAALMEVGFKRIGISPDHIYVDNDDTLPPMLSIFTREPSLLEYWNRKKNREKNK